MEKKENVHVEKFKHIYNVIGKNVKKFRKAKGWTQQQLADECEDVTRAKVSKIENAYEDYMFSTLLEVIDALGKTLSEIPVEDEE